MAENGASERVFAPEHFSSRLTLPVSLPGLTGQSSIPGLWLLDRPVNPRIKSGEGDDSTEAGPGGGRKRHPPTAAPAARFRLFRDRLGGGLVLVENPHLDVARRLVGKILLAVDGAARNVVAVAGLEHVRRLSLDGEGDFALLHRGPL